MIPPNISLLSLVHVIKLMFPTHITNITYTNIIIKNIAANFIRDEFIKSDLTGSAKGIDNYFQKLH